MSRVLVIVCLVGCHHPAHDKPAPPESRKGQKRAPETLLYVDGVPRASISYGEALRAGPLCDYLGDLGVPCAAVRALHLYAPGGAVTPLGDLKNAQLELEPGAAPKIGGSEVRTVTVYVGKEPPPLPVQGIPYLDEKVRGGTRINVDGRLATRLKRNQLEDDLPEPYALADLAERRHLGTPRAVELVTGDDQVVRVPDGEVGKITFAAEAERHGQMSFRFGERAVPVVAVNLYVAATPPVRAPARAAAPTARQAGFTAGCSVVW